LKIEKEKKKVAQEAGLIRTEVTGSEVKNNFSELINFISSSGDDDITCNDNFHY